MIFIRWFISAATLLAIATYFPGVEVVGWYAALISSLMLGLVNAIIRPVLIFFTLPITVITLGFFTLVINALLFWFVASFIDGFSVAGFWPAFWGAIVMSVVGWAVNSISKK